VLPSPHHLPHRLHQLSPLDLLSSHIDISAPPPLIHSPPTPPSSFSLDGRQEESRGEGESSCWTENGGRGGRRRKMRLARFIGRSCWSLRGGLDTVGCWHVGPTCVLLTLGILQTTFARMQLEKTIMIGSNFFWVKESFIN
jgi:hypothetical protein